MAYYSLFSFGVFNLYEFAPLLYTALGVIVTMLVGMLASAITRKLTVII